MRRRAPILAIIAFVVVVVGLAISLAVILVSLLPDMMAFAWFLIITLPLTIGIAFVGLVLAVIALVLDIRARRTLVWSILATVLGALTVILPATLIYGPDVQLF